MSTEHEEQLEELRTIVTRLGDALVLSERRASRLERTVRWAVLGTLSALGMVLLVVLRPLGLAAAQQGLEPVPSKSVEQAIDRLTTSLTGEGSTIGMLGQIKYAMMREGTERAVEEAKYFSGLSREYCQPGSVLSPEMKAAQVSYPLGFFTQCYFLRNGISDPSAQDYQHAILSAASGIAVDLGVLVSRVRDDSDLIRHFVVEYVGDSSRLTQRIGQELATLNKTLESVPVMTSSVNTMTYQMGIMAADMRSMTNSLGSTMGRMGSWMPW